MLLLTAGALALCVVGYYLLREEEKGDTGGPDIEVEEGPEPQSRQPRRTGEAQVHTQRVRTYLREEFDEARSRAREAQESGNLEQLARESYFLTEAVKEMFGSDEFFERGHQVRSYEAALQAAIEARERALRWQREEEPPRTVVTNDSNPTVVTENYVGAALESALVVCWCAGGLVGENRLSAAEEVFQMPVSADRVEEWSEFQKLLRQERQARKT